MKDLSFINRTLVHSVHNFTVVMIHLCRFVGLGRSVEIMKDMIEYCYRCPEVLNPKRFAMKVIDAIKSDWIALRQKASDRIEAAATASDIVQSNAAGVPFVEMDNAVVGELVKECVTESTASISANIAQMDVALELPTMSMPIHMAIPVILIGSAWWLFGPAIKTLWSEFTVENVALYLHDAADRLKNSCVPYTPKLPIWTPNIWSQLQSHCIDSIGSRVFTFGIVNDVLIKPPENTAAGHYQTFMNCPSATAMCIGALTLPNVADRRSARAQAECPHPERYDAWCTKFVKQDNVITVSEGVVDLAVAASVRTSTTSAVKTISVLRQDAERNGAYNFNTGNGDNVFTEALAQCINAKVPGEARWLAPKDAYSDSLPVEAGRFLSSTIVKFAGESELTPIKSSNLSNPLAYYGSIHPRLIFGMPYAHFLTTDLLVTAFIPLWLVLTGVFLKIVTFNCMQNMPLFVTRSLSAYLPRVHRIGRTLMSGASLMGNLFCLTGSLVLAWNLKIVYDQMINDSAASLNTSLTRWSGRPNPTPDASSAAAAAAGAPQTVMEPDERLMMLYRNSSVNVVVNKSLISSLIRNNKWSANVTQLQALLDDGTLALLHLRAAAAQLEEQHHSYRINSNLRRSLVGLFRLRNPLSKEFWDLLSRHSTQLSIEHSVTNLSKTLMCATGRDYLLKDSEMLRCGPQTTSLLRDIQLPKDKPTSDEQLTTYSEAPVVTCVDLSKKSSRGKTRRHPASSNSNSEKG
jgi:hypothetical protein